MYGCVFMALLPVVVLRDVVEVVSADDNSLLQLHLVQHTRQDPPLNGDITSKGVFLISVSALNGLLGHPEDLTHVLVVL